MFEREVWGDAFCGDLTDLLRCCRSDGWRGPIVEELEKAVKPGSGQRMLRRLGGGQVVSTLSS